MARDLLLIMDAAVMDKEDSAMKSILIFIAIIAIWFSLNRWILPMLGIQT